MKPYKIYAEVLEQGAIDQFNEALAQDFVVKAALMPDAHQGYTLPIGAVVACDNAVVPSYVGFDIGCGMCAVKTSFSKQDVKDNSKSIFDEIYKSLPVGFKRHKECLDVNVSDLIEKHNPTEVILEQLKDGALSQIGTLGSGNHFLEIGYDENNNVWIIVHSGSRNLGHKTATHYMKEASKLHTGIDKAKDGHFDFKAYSDLGKQYIRDLNFCLDFALLNREVILSIACEAMGKFCNGAMLGVIINKNHNHAVLEDGLWVHRKGATHARKGMYGVIPGNMRDGAFIVIGKGNTDSLYSSSHGAGRVLGRKQAKEHLNLDDFKDTMQGITARVGNKTLDESPFAYKNIFEVMNLQDDLVEIHAHVKPMINIKG